MLWRSRSLWLKGIHYDAVFTLLFLVTGAATVASRLGMRGLRDRRARMRLGMTTAFHLYRHGPPCYPRPVYPDAAKLRTVPAGADRLMRNLRGIRHDDDFSSSPRDLVGMV